MLTYKLKINTFQHYTIAKRGTSIELECKNRKKNFSLMNVKYGIVFCITKFWQTVPLHFTCIGSLYIPNDFLKTGLINFIPLSIFFYSLKDKLPLLTRIWSSYISQLLFTFLPLIKRLPYFSKPNYSFPTIKFTFLLCLNRITKKWKNGKRASTVMLEIVIL